MLGAAGALGHLLALGALEQVSWQGEGVHCGEGAPTDSLGLPTEPSRRRCALQTLCSSQAAAAVPVGFFLFVVAWVFLIVVGFGFPYSPKYSAAAVACFSTLPWTLLAKGIQDLADASQGAGWSGWKLGWWWWWRGWLAGWVV